MKKRRVMLDGVIAGAELSGCLDVLDSEVNKVRRVLLASGAVEAEDIAVTVKGKTNMVVALRKHYHQKNRFYLNITGNPLSFLQGSNVYGYAEADRVIVTAFRSALESLAGRMPARLMKAIAERQINIHSMEFATYTNKILDKARLLNDWAYVYQFAYSSLDGREHWALTDLLDLKFSRKHKDHRSSVCLRIMSKDGREEEAMLEAYDKARQLRDEAKSSGSVAYVPADVESRIRLDLHLNYGWFRRHQIKGRKIKTLADLVEYVAAHGGWQAFLASEFQWALDRSLLFYMWSFDVKAVLKGEYAAHKNKRVNERVYKVLTAARALKTLTDDERIALIQTGRVSRRKLNLDPHPELLELDMGMCDG